MRVFRALRFWAVAAAVLLGAAWQAAAQGDPICKDIQEICGAQVPASCVPELASERPGATCAPAVEGYRSCLAQASVECGQGFSSEGSFSLRCRFLTISKATLKQPHDLPIDVVFTVIDKTRGEGWGGGLYTKTLGRSDSGEFGPDILYGVFEKPELSYWFSISRRTGEIKTQISAKGAAGGILAMSGSCGTIAFQPIPDP